MSEIEIIKETPISLVETNVILEKIKKKDKDLDEKQQKTQEYIHKLTKLTEKEVKEVKKKLEGIDLQRLKTKHITKIIDVMPQDMDSLKALFTSEPMTLKQEELNKILECLK